MRDPEYLNKLDSNIAHIFGIEGEKKRKYSTDISAAWEVLNHLVEIKKIPEWELRYVSPYWSVIAHFPDEVRVLSVAKQAPVAICEAAIVVRVRGYNQQPISACPNCSGKIHHIDTDACFCLDCDWDSLSQI